MKKIYKVSIVGHFGFGKELLNGQTIKTKVIADEIEREYGVRDVLKIDTHGGIKALVKLPFQLIFASMKSENTLIFPAYNGLRIIAPLLILYKIFFNSRIHYVVIGGWLPEFITKKPILRKILYKFDYIYVETNSMKSMLEHMGYMNVIVMKNCKKLRIVTKEELIYRTCAPFKLCTFSRIRKEKGIEDAVAVVKEINECMKKTLVELDIYGQVDSDQVDWFKSIEEEFPTYVTYKGTVGYNKSSEILKSYYALLFPTYYEGEGFAGTLIDALAAGIPVIASDWKYNSEIVIDGKTGVLYASRNNGELKREIMDAIVNVERWNKMKENCLDTAKWYQPEYVVSILKERLG